MSVALSIVYPSRDALLLSELQNLANSLSPATYLLLGGTSVDYYRSIQEGYSRCMFLRSYV